MAQITVPGWIAEGGGRLYHMDNGDLILFDVIENRRIRGESDKYENEYGTIPAWFHCSYQIQGGKPQDRGFVPEGFTIDRVNRWGYARVVKIDDASQSLPKNPCLSCEQVVDFFQEGKMVKVKGEEVLMKGDDGELMRNIIVQKIDFLVTEEHERPHILKVPYKSYTCFI